MPGNEGHPRSLIVRIYRHGYATLAGVVEDAATGVERSFVNPEELWEAVQSMVAMKPKRRRRRRAWLG
jgi:hypothetical protein